MKKLGRIAAAFMASVFFVTGIPAMTAFAADGYSTTLANGEYTTDDFTFAWEGGTGKAHLELNKIIVTDGQAQGVFTASSEYMTHVYYLGHTSSEVDDPNYYDPSTDTCQNGVVPISGKQVSFPVALNEKTAIACRTTRMEEPHWVQYYYTITIDESLVTDADYTAVDAAIASVPTDLSIYTDESATAVTTAVNAVVRNLPASRQEEVDAMAAAITAAINGLELKSAEGKALHFIIVPDEQDESKNIEDPTNYSINLGAELVFEIIFSSMPSADFETTLNNQLSGLFTKTGGKGWQNEDGTVTGFYRYKAVATGEVTLPLNDNYSVVLTVADSEEPDDSQIELTIENKTGMFKADTATLETVDGQKTLVVALSGTGYHELFKGTYEQAVANGANTDNWVHGEINAEGKWEFRIPVADNENYIPIVAISDSYYNKYLNGQNTLERAFYPRQMDLDVEAKTLVTDDYHSSKEITVTNNVSKFKVNTPAVLNTVGGPNSNNYKSDLVLTMGSNSYDQVFVGTYAEANEATKTIQLAEDNSFAIPVKWVETFGDPTTLKTLTDGQQFAISFRSASKQTWYERLAKLDEEAGTLIFDPSTADYSVVDAAKAKVPADLSIYTEETAKAVTDAVDAVETGKFASQQEEVDAMAKAIEDAIAALKTKPGVLKVVNNVKMFSPVSATLDSNDGKEIVNLTMKSESFDKIFLGKANAVDDSKT
ncbi:MAG: hypothetical protein IKG00_07735, partial [Lachnospiraceae bacterium]|nr:hypothetical protein [Lachnospiraceae bacterium]